MIEALTNLRESGQVLSSWIADETRSLDNFVGSPTSESGCWKCCQQPGLILGPEKRSAQRCQSVLCSGRADQWPVRGIPAHDDRFELTSFASGSVRRRP